MKKYLIAAIAVVFLFGTVAYAKELVKINVTTAVLVGDALPNGLVKRFIDGNNVCYIYQGGSPSISCLKK